MPTNFLVREGFYLLVNVLFTVCFPCERIAGDSNFRELQFYAALHFHFMQLCGLKLEMPAFQYVSVINVHLLDF